MESSKSRYMGERCLAETDVPVPSTDVPLDSIGFAFPEVIWPVLAIQIGVLQSGRGGKPRASCMFNEQFK
jgi:hypothetical protein